MSFPVYYCQLFLKSMYSDVLSAGWLLLWLCTAEGSLIITRGEYITESNKCVINAKLNSTTRCCLPLFCHDEQELRAYSAAMLL